MVSLTEAKAECRSSGFRGAGENAAHHPSIASADRSGRLEKARQRPTRRRRGRDFHAERVRERDLRRSVLFLIFLLGGAAAAFAVMTLFNR